MALKKPGFVLLAIFVLGSISAKSATAAATETNGFWYKLGGKLAGGLRPSITCSQVGEWTLTSTVPPLATPLKLKATATTCPEGVIFNENSKAKAREHIRLTGVTVVEPEPTKCSVAGGEIETEPLKTQVWMEGTEALARFSPAAGVLWAEPAIVGCPYAETYPINGIVFAEFVNPTGVESGDEELEFSGAINTLAGGALTFDGNAAAITGKTKVVLTAGGTYAVNET